MDNRRTLILILLLLPLLFYWAQISDYLLQKMGYDTSRPQLVDNKTAPTTQEIAATLPSSAPTTAGAVGAATASMASAGLHVAPSTQPDTGVELGSVAPKDPNFHMGLRIHPQGAALDWVVLNEFKLTAEGSTLYTFQQPYSGDEASRALASRGLSVNGNTIDLTRVPWSLESSDASHAVFGVTVLDTDNTPLVRVHKKFELSRPSDPDKGYEIVVTQTFENLTSQPLKIAATFNGPTLPPHEGERGSDLLTFAGYAVKGIVNVNHEYIESYTAKAPTRDLTQDSGKNPILWAGTASSYFNALVHPLPLGDPKSPAEYIANVTATVLNPNAQKASEHQIQMEFKTSEQTIAAGQSLSLPMRVFFGPRQRSLLNDAYYAEFPRSYGNTLVITSGPCGFCTFQWLIDILVKVLVGFHFVTRDWGLAIIALVILVRAILHPITKRSQISMSKMSKMGPEMERLKVKYKDQPDELNKAMMQFYKEQGATPVLGCLPMFLQMPIWIALWQALQTTFELRQAPFLHPFGIPLTWINDLSMPDHLIKFSHSYDFLFLHITGLNILPLLMALVFFLQQKFQPKPASMTPEQEQQQKMMQWMTVALFPIMLYAGPSGLNLYILTSTAIGIVEAKIVRDHIKAREEAEKAGRVIIDPGAKLRRGGGDQPTRKPESSKSSGLMKWLSDLQQKADEIKRDNEKKSRDDKRNGDKKK
jgi:YidC/Oxa1 family membrane protein insertase